jgi:hypothetical protein
MKGLVALSDDPTRPLVAHAVQHVFIGRDLPTDILREGFAACQA